MGPTERTELAECGRQNGEILQSWERRTDPDFSRFSPFCGPSSVASVARWGLCGTTSPSQIKKIFQLPAERPNEIVELRFERRHVRKRSLLAFKWRVAGSMARKIDRIVVDQKKVLILLNLISCLHATCAKSLAF